MYILNKDITPGMVVWGEKNIYYDQPEKILKGRTCMYVVTMVNDDYFFGCPLSTQSCMKNSTILSAKRYPIKYDSRVNESLFKLYYSQIVSPDVFKITPGTFENFKRNLYKKIILNQADSPKNYNELFVEEYLREHVPSIDNIIVYPSEEKIYKFYYIYDEDEEYYIGVKLNQEKKNDRYYYSVCDKELIPLSKEKRYFDYFTTHSLSREAVENIVEGRSFQKTIGKYPRK